jgi:hypothetical protein
MSRRKSCGRIRFPGNPWPDGHAVTEFAWTARVERGTGIWLDLHLRTEDYDAADGPSTPEDVAKEESTETDWESKIVWCNYKRCTLSSVAWPGVSKGFLVATDREPLDWKAFSKRVFLVDERPFDFVDRERRAFNIYLTGHDAVGYHRIAFRREPGKLTFSIDWRGRIALSYAGSTEFKHEFEAKLTGISFGGIEFPAGVDRQQALDLARPFVDSLAAYSARSRGGRLYVVPK